MKHVNQESGASTAHSDDGPFRSPALGMSTWRDTRLLPVCVGVSVPVWLCFILSYRRMDWMRPNGVSGEHLHQQRVAQYATQMGCVCVFVCRTNVNFDRIESNVLYRSEVVATTAERVGSSFCFFAKRLSSLLSFTRNHTLFSPLRQRCVECYFHYYSPAVLAQKVN